jgi:hypothetical protein
VSRHKFPHKFGQRFILDTRLNNGLVTCFITRNAIIVASIKYGFTRRDGLALADTRRTHGVGVPCVGEGKLIPFLCSLLDYSYT